MKLSGSAVVLALIAGTFFTSCGGNSNNALDLNNASTGQIYADNWDSVEVDANLAKTKLTATGHYETTKNACNRPGDGAMTLEEWNAFAQSMNRAVTQIKATDPLVCFDIDFRACMDGTANVVRDDGSKIPLFQPNPQGGGGTICTHLQDRDLAQQLYKSVNGLTYAADRAGCSLDYERCTR